MDKHSSLFWPSLRNKENRFVTLTSGMIIFCQFNLNLNCLENVLFTNTQAYFGLSMSKNKNNFTTLRPVTHVIQLINIITLVKIIVNTSLRVKITPKKFNDIETWRKFVDQGLGNCWNWRAHSSHRIDDTLKWQNIDKLNSYR